MMKTHSFLMGLVLAISSCTGSGTHDAPRSASQKDSVNVRQPQADSSNWLNSFREFRTAVYQKDKAGVKKFFRFPVMNENNEIWYLAFQNDDDLIRDLPDTVKAFSGKDFDRYWKNIF